MTTENDYFQTFCNISLAFGTVATVDELLQLIVQSATETMNGKAACLFLADQKQNVFVPKAKFGLSDKYMHANPITAKKLVSALQETGFFMFEDATTDPRLENHEAKKEEGIASILTVEVKVGGHLIGILSLYTADQRKFTEQEVVFMKALASNGGIAIKKARLLERIEKNSVLFLELASAINSSLDIKEVLRSMSEKSCNAFGMKGVVIRLLNEDTNALEMVASHGLSEAFLSKGFVLVEKSVTEALQGKIVVIEDVSKEKRLQYPKETKEEGINSMVCVPIRSREKIIGVMRLYSSCIRKYPQDFITIMEAIAHTGALAIQNASMYLALKEDKKSLEEDIWSHRLYF
ncbi:MAG: GAF domain-containing protein [Desulforhopalus sp.]|nr:GAF domain-containing protein [Desulforhopalus sp.]